MAERHCGTCRHAPATPGNACGIICDTAWSGWSPRNDHNGPPETIASAYRARKLFTNEIMEEPMDAIDAPLKFADVSYANCGIHKRTGTIGGVPYDIPLIQVNVETGETWPPRPKGILIALTSPAMASGKSEAAKALIGEGFEPMKFAAVLKGMTRTLLDTGLGLDPQTIEAMVEGDRKEIPIPGLDVTPRHLMQTLGTEWRMMIREDLWVCMIEQRLRKLLDKGVNVVIDDMRFKVELEMVRRLKGHAVRIVRPGVNPVNGHASEGELDREPMDAITNDGSLRMLRAKVLDYLDALQCNDDRPVPACPDWAGPGYAPWATTH